MYHGGRSWTGVPSVQPPKRGRAEHGPGIYLTTITAYEAVPAKGFKGPFDLPRVTRRR